MICRKLLLALTLAAVICLSTGKDVQKRAATQNKQISKRDVSDSDHLSARALELLRSLDKELDELEARAKSKKNTEPAENVDEPSLIISSRRKNSAPDWKRREVLTEKTEKNEIEQATEKESENTKRGLFVKRILEAVMDYMEDDTRK